MSDLETTSSNNNPTEQNENTSMIQMFAKEYLADKRKQRRRSLILRTLFLIWLTVIIFQLTSSNISPPLLQKPHVAVIDLNGTISASEDVRADSTLRAIKRALKHEHTVGVILRINSPGGSPVESDIIFHQILSYRKQFPNKPIHAVCRDYCASGAYYIASAAQNIYANQSSLIGSIGVVYNGFGFVGTMEKLGVERRAFTAGKNKAFLDPFSPINPEEVGIMKTMLADLHTQFITDVKKGRGDRIKDESEVFSGLFWTGIRAKELGLVDGFANVYEVAKQEFNTDVLVNYTEMPNYFERAAKMFGQTMGVFSPSLPNSQLLPLGSFKS